MRRYIEYCSDANWQTSSQIMRTHSAQDIYLLYVSVMELSQQRKYITYMIPLSQFASSSAFFYLHVQLK